MRDDQERSYRATPTGALHGTRAAGPLPPINRPPVTAPLHGFELPSAETRRFEQEQDALRRREGGLPQRRAGDLCFEVGPDGAR